MCKPSDIEELFSSSSNRYLSTKQISRKLKTTEKDVLNQISSCSFIFESFIIPEDGSKLFGFRKRVNRLQDIWNTIRHISYLKATA